MNEELLQFIPITRGHISYRMKWLNDLEINYHLGTIVRNGTDKAFL